MVSALRKDYVDACAGHAAALTAQLQYTNTPYRLLEESLLRSEVGVAFALEGDTTLRDRLHTAWWKCSPMAPLRKSWPNTVWTRPML